MAKEVIWLSAAVVKSSRLHLAVRVVDGDAESSEEGLRAHGRGLRAHGRGTESRGSLAGFSVKLDSVSG